MTKNKQKTYTFMPTLQAFTNLLKPSLAHCFNCLEQKKTWATFFQTPCSSVSIMSEIEPIYLCRADSHTSADGGCPIVEFRSGEISPPSVKDNAVRSCGHAANTSQHHRSTYFESDNHAANKFVHKLCAIRIEGILTGNVQNLTRNPTQCIWGLLWMLTS